MNGIIEQVAGLMPTPAAGVALLLLAGAKAFETASPEARKWVALFDERRARRSRNDVEQ